MKAIFYGLVIAVLLIISACKSSPDNSNSSNSNSSSSASEPLSRSRSLANEQAAIAAIRQIVQAQTLYSVTQGQGKFTDLKTLGAEGLIDSTLASGEKYDYVFSVSAVAAEGTAPMFDVTARPKNSSVGTRSFYSNETAAIYQADGAEPPRATAEDRVPRNGSPVR